MRGWERRRCVGARVREVGRCKVRVGGVHGGIVVGIGGEGVARREGGAHGVGVGGVRGPSGGREGEVRGLGVGRGRRRIVPECGLARREQARQSGRARAQHRGTGAAAGRGRSGGGRVAPVERPSRRGPCHRRPRDRAALLRGGKEFR